jgi:hypothetical protein
MSFKSNVTLQVMIIMVTITVAAMTSSAEYILVDKNVPEAEKVIKVHSGDRQVEFLDRTDRKVFEAAWDASGKQLIVRGDNVYLRIHSNGKIEKLTTLQDNQQNNIQQPITVQPIVPIYPRQPSGTTAPAAPSTTR